MGGGVSYSCVVGVRLRRRNVLSYSFAGRDALMGGRYYDYACGGAGYCIYGCSDM